MYAIGRDCNSLIGCDESKDTKGTSGTKTAGGTFVAVPSEVSCFYVNKLGLDGKRIVDAAASVYSSFLLTGLDKHTIYIYYLLCCVLLCRFMN